MSAGRTTWGTTAIVMAAALLALPGGAGGATAAAADAPHKAAVKAAIGKRFTLLAGCLGDFAAEHPQVKEVSLKFMVDEKGGAFHVVTVPGDPLSEACIANLLDSISLPPSLPPRVYSFRIDLDAHVRTMPAASSVTMNDAVAMKAHAKATGKKPRRHTLALDLLMPVLTASIGVGSVFLWEYEAVVSRWAAIELTGITGRVDMKHTEKFDGEKYHGFVTGTGGGGGGGVRIFPLGKAPSGLIVGVRVQAYAFRLHFTGCPAGYEQKCRGGLRNLDLLAELGWRFVLPFGLTIHLAAEGGVEWGRSLLGFDSDPAAAVGGKVAVGWAF